MRCAVAVRKLLAGKPEELSHGTAL
jgi:hypothetical protein